MLRGALENALGVRWGCVLLLYTCHAPPTTIPQVSFFALILPLIFFLCFEVRNALYTYW